MNSKTILIVGAASVLYCCKLSAEEADVNALSDNYFKYTIGEIGTNALECANKDATLGDLYRFVNAECWNRYLKFKFENGEKLTRKDAEALDLCIDVHLEMLDAIGEVMLRDLLGDAGFQRYVVVVPNTNQLNKVLDEGELNRLRLRFIISRETVGEAISRWADDCRAYNYQMVSILHNVFYATDAFDKLHLWIDDNPFPGWRLSHRGAKDLVGLLAQGVFEELSGSDPRDAAHIAKRATNKKGTQIGESWWSLRKQVQLYANEIREICDKIDSMRNAGISDSVTKKILNDATSKWEHRCTLAIRKFDYLLYDLPFCMMSHKALERLNNCKGGFFCADNEVEMRRVAADYSYAICGTEMLKGIRTRYAASCYTEIIKFLKAELGWFTSSAFREFANETKLYNITLRADENSRQDNTLEKWK